MKTLRGFINRKDGTDYDVIDSYADDLCIAHCCDCRLTDVGRITYKEILNLPIEVIDVCTVMVEVTTGRQHKLLKQMLYSMAGYCSEQDWDKLFYTA